jgi:hypothetical protein
VLLSSHLADRTGPGFRALLLRASCGAVDAFDFELSPDEIATIDALDTGVRGGPDPSTIDTKTIPLTIDN